MFSARKAGWANIVGLWSARPTLIGLFAAEANGAVDSAPTTTRASTKMAVLGFNGFTRGQSFRDGSLVMQPARPPEDASLTRFSSRRDGLVEAKALRLRGAVARIDLDEIGGERLEARCAAVDEPGEPDVAAVLRQVARAAAAERSGVQRRQRAGLLELGRVRVALDDEQRALRRVGAQLVDRELGEPGGVHHDDVDLAGERVQPRGEGAAVLVGRRRAAILVAVGREALERVVVAGDAQAADARDDGPVEKSAVNRPARVRTTAPARASWRSSASESWLPETNTSCVPARRIRRASSRSRRDPRSVRSPAKSSRPPRAARSSAGRAMTLLCRSDAIVSRGSVGSSGARLAGAVTSRAMPTSCSSISSSSVLADAPIDSRVRSAAGTSGPLA